MCYVVFLSTSSSEDLSTHNSELVHFIRDLGDEPAVQLLQYPFQWFVSYRGGCSCGFRHMTTPEFGFGTPEEWCPEDPEHLQTTAEFFAVVRNLIAEGHKVDCVDAWTMTECALIKRMDVPVSTLRDGEFRFFENHQFLFSE